MDFVTNVVLSFFIGGLYVAGVVWLSERLGSRIGGIVAGLPSTLLVSAIFISISEGPEVTRSALAIVPLMFFAALLYALVFLKASVVFKRFERHPNITVIAVMVWLLTAVVVKSLASIPFYVLVSITLVGLLAGRYFFRHLAATTAPPVKISSPYSIHLFHFLTGGAVVASAVLAAHFLDPAWGGIISSFPATLGTVLYFLDKSQGELFLRGFLRRLPLGYISSLIFVTLLYATITALPLYFSFMIAIVGSLSYTFILIASRQIIK